MCSDDGAENRSMSSSDEGDSDHDHDDDDYMIREAEIPAAGEKHSKCI